MKGTLRRKTKNSRKTRNMKTMGRTSTEMGNNQKLDRKIKKFKSPTGTIETQNQINNEIKTSIQNVTF